MHASQGKLKLVYIWHSFLSALCREEHQVCRFLVAANQELQEDPKHVFGLLLRADILADGEADYLVDKVSRLPQRCLF